MSTRQKCIIAVAGSIIALVLLSSCSNDDSAGIQPVSLDAEFIQRVQSLKATGDDQKIQELYSKKYCIALPSASKDRGTKLPSYTQQFDNVYPPYSSEGRNYTARAFTQVRYYAAGRLVVLSAYSDGSFVPIPNTNPDPMAFIIQYEDNTFKTTGVLNPSNQYSFSIKAANDDHYPWGLGSCASCIIPESGYYQLVVTTYGYYSWGRVRIKEMTAGSQTVGNWCEDIGGATERPYADIVRSTAAYDYNNTIDTRLWSFNFDTKIGYYGDNRYFGYYYTYEGCIINADNNPLYKYGYGIFDGQYIYNRIFGDMRPMPDYLSFRMRGYSL